MTDLELAFNALKNKQSGYNTYWDYYDGNHPLVYSAARLREVFAGLDARFHENWCAVVVDSCLERLQLQRFVVGADEKGSAALNARWTAAEMDLDSGDAHLAALVCGEAFIVAWKDEEGEPEVYYNDPRLCHVQYDEENPKKKAWAAKWWKLPDNRYRLTLYYSGRLEYYITPKPTQGGVIPSSAKAFVPLEGEGLSPRAENPYGVIPVFHLRRERRAIRSELANVIAPQNAANKLISDMMVAAEFGAFRQRWIITNADTGALKSSPGELWEFPPMPEGMEGTKIGEFSSTDLDNFLKAIEGRVNAISAITRTPKHFFFAQGSVPSGEALIALEAPLNKKCERYVARFGNTWQRVAAFLLLLESGEVVDPEEITPLFADPATVQPRTEAEIREIRVRAGEPLVYVMRDQGASEADLEQMLKDKQEETARAQESLAQALLAQQRSFDQEDSEESDA